MGVDATKFSIDFLKPPKPTEPAAGNSGWENAALTALQNQGKQDVEMLFKTVLGSQASLGSQEMNYNQFAEMIDDLIKRGKVEIVRSGSVPSEFEVSLPKPS